jgi:hypothetical protein
MQSRERQMLADTPWFWLLTFSLMALLALLVIGPKYNRRQAGIEWQYQARERVAEKLATENNPAVAPRIDTSEPAPNFATPDNKLVPLWPLAILLALVAAASACMLFKASRAVRSAELVERPGPDTVESP